MPFLGIGIDRLSFLTSGVGGLELISLMSFVKENLLQKLLCPFSGLLLGMSSLAFAQQKPQIATRQPIPVSNGYFAALKQSAETHSFKQNVGTRQCGVARTATTR